MIGLSLQPQGRAQARATPPNRPAEWARLGEQKSRTAFPQSIPEPSLQVAGSEPALLSTLFESRRSPDRDQRHAAGTDGSERRRLHRHLSVSEASRSAGGHTRSSAGVTLLPS